MAEIINLRRARKQKKRDEKAEQSAANRAKYGRSKAAQNVQSHEVSSLHQHLDNHKVGKTRKPNDREDA